MQSECLLKCWVSIICSLEHFYLQAIIPLINITLKSSFYDAAQVSDSQSFQSSFSQALVKLKHNYRTFGGDSKVLRYFTLLSQRTEGKLAHYEGMNVNCHYKLLPLVFSECPTYMALEVVRLILRKSTF